jgi:hypothetical protein
MCRVSTFTDRGIDEDFRCNKLQELIVDTCNCYLSIRQEYYIQALAIECPWYEATDGLNLGVRPALICCYQCATAHHVFASTQERYYDTKRRS